jgi:hypothetical protein
MEDNLLSLFERERCVLARADYGYEVAAPAGWAEADLERAPFQEAAGQASAGQGLLVRSSGLLLGWSKTRSAPELWGSLRTLARRGPLLLLCRFPRHAQELQSRLKAAGLPHALWETQPSGEVPPLYRRLPPGSELRRLHLRYEWATGLAAARGGVALRRVAFLLAEAGPMTVPALARSLGLTSGAARSYARWMEEAALVRRAGSSLELRHPLLAELFRKPPPAETTSAPQERAWNPIELD